MHLDNLSPLLRLWPLVVILTAGLLAFYLFESGRRARDQRRILERDRKYWLAEFAYRARMRAREWLTRTKTPRLTYQGPPIDESSKPADRRRAGASRPAQLPFAGPRHIAGPCRSSPIVSPAPAFAPGIAARAKRIT